MSASGGWGFHPCHLPCLLLYHLILILGSSGGRLGFLAFSLLPFVSVTVTFCYVTFVIVVMTFGTVTTGDGTPEMVRMGHCFPFFSVLLSFQLQQTTTAMVAVWGMTGSSLVIDRLTVEEWGCTCFRLNLIYDTQVTPPFTSTLVGISGTFRSFPFATFRGRGATSTQVSLDKFLHMGVILPLKGQLHQHVHKVLVRVFLLFLSEVVRQSSHVRVGISLMSHRWGSVAP